MIIGYARVSTDDQTLDAQIDALEDAGAERIFKEKQTGKTRNRIELSKLLDQLRSEDVVIVTKYDRLARSLRDHIEIVDNIRERGAGFRSLGEDIDTTTSAGRLVFHVFGSIAEFERERIVERTKEGLAAARRRGRIGGRPPLIFMAPDGAGQIKLYPYRLLINFLFYFSFVFIILKRISDFLRQKPKVSQPT